MKKLFTISMVILFSQALFAQEKSGDMKNLRFGVTALPSLTWYKPDDLKKFKKNGTTPRFGVMLNGEYSFSGNFAIGFGIGMGSTGGKIEFLDSTHYFVYDDEIIALASLDTAGTTYKEEHFFLENREYKASYYYLPVSLKMRTNEIGYMRYFFEPRLNVGIRKKVRADDNVSVWGSGNNVTNENLNISTDMSPINMTVTLSAGCEYYVAGSTAFIFAIGYDYGLSNVVKGESDFIYRNKNKIDEPLKQKFTQQGLVLSVGVLF